MTEYSTAPTGMAHCCSKLLQVWINQYNLLNNNVPFGGKKQSGIGTDFLFVLIVCSPPLSNVIFPFFCDLVSFLSGRELGSYALEEYTSVKAVHWNFGEKLDWPF